MRYKTSRQADKILVAAAQLFATHRFHEARMEDIAALAEVGKGTLYRYFHDKDELYLALLQRASEGLEERLATCAAAAGAPREQLVGVVAALIAYFDEHPHLFDLIQHAEVMQRSSLHFSWQQARTRTILVVKELLAAGTAAGLFAVDDLDLAALMLLGGIRAVLRFSARPRPADLAERIVAGFLDGHAAAASPRCGLLAVPR